MKKLILFIFLIFGSLSLSSIGLVSTFSAKEHATNIKTYSKPKPEIKIKYKINSGATINEKARNFVGFILKFCFVLVSKILFCILNL